MVSVHATPTACKTPTLAVCVPRWTRAARRERERGRREDRAGLACRCSQKQGLFPLERGVGDGGNRKGHVHIVNICKHTHTHTHTHRAHRTAP